MTPPRSAIELTDIVFPEQANHYGTLFAGHALQSMAKAAFLAGRSSLTVCVTGLAHALGAAPEEVLNGVFEMVAVDATGRPVPIKPQYDASSVKQETFA